ncbi:MAG TPA: hypothetical protein VGF94_29070 [Kofleriaceae bacterium]|jgi:hypothetical protein
MTTRELMAFAFLGLGFALQLSGGWRMLSSRVSFGVANDMLVKLLRAGDLDRARTVCRAAPGTYLIAVECALASPAAGRLDAFEMATAVMVRDWRRTAERGIAGTIFAIIGIAMEWSHISVFVQVVPIALGVWLFAMRTYMARACAAARRDVLPAICSPP